MNADIRNKLIAGVTCDVLPLMEKLHGDKNGKLLIIALKESSLEAAFLAAINAGWKLDVNLFDARIFVKQFLPVYLLYNKDFLFFDHKEVITLSFNEKCTLKCKNCSASIPYIVPREYSFQEVSEDAKKLFEIVDYIEILRIGGAETFLYKDLDKIVSYIHEHCEKQYGCMELTTNGTVEVNKQLLDVLHDCRVRVCISDYSNRFPKIKERHLNLIERLQASDTMYSYLEDMEWVDFGFNNTERKAMGDTIMWHDCCAHPCKDFRNGRLYSCSQAYWAQRRYEEFADEDDSLDITNGVSKKEIFEYIRGYNVNGYLKPCIICNGHVNINSRYVPVAEQL